MKPSTICFLSVLVGLLVVGCSDGPMSFLGDGEEALSTNSEYAQKGNPRVVATGEAGFVAGHGESPNRPIKYRSLAFEILEANNTLPVEGEIRFTVLNEDSTLHRKTTVVLDEFYRAGNTIWLIGDVLTDEKYGGGGCSDGEGSGGCDHDDTGGCGGGDTGGTDTGGCDHSDTGPADTGGCDHDDTGETETGGCDHGDTGGMGGTGGMSDTGGLGGPGTDGGGGCDHDDTGGTDTGGCDHDDTGGTTSGCDHDDTGGTDTGGCDHGDTDTGGCSGGSSDSHGGGSDCQGGACGHSGSASRVGDVFMAKFVDAGTPARNGDLAAWKWKVMNEGASRPNITHHDNWKLCTHELIEGNLVVRDW